LNYPSTSRDDFQTALTDEDVAGLSAVMAYVTINRVKPVHSTTYAFRMTFVQRGTSDERGTLAYALDVQCVDDEGPPATPAGVDPEPSARATG
jgi:hypothetical protein